MLRFALIILALYTVALSCIPCQDEVLDMADEQTTIHIKASGQKQTPATDLCSPFCICSCCAGVTIEDGVTAISSNTTFSIFEEINFSYTSHLPSADLTPVWQPPRV